MVVEQSPSMPATVICPRGSIRSSEAPVKSTSTSIPMDTHILLSTMLPDKMEEGAKPSVLDKDPPSSGITAGSSTCVTEQKPERNATTSGNAGLAVTQKIPPYLPPRQLAEVVVDRAAGQSTIVDMVSPLAPRLDPKSPYIPPHRRRHSVPDIRPVINGTSSTAPNEELYVSPKSEYRNLLRVLWTEANLKGDLQMREKINRCSTLNTSSSTISVLIASKLSLDHDKIRNALCEDRKCIRARLFHPRKMCLSAEGHAHRILDLAQDISDNLDSLSNVDASSSLPRLIFKLCVACDRLPSSLSITGVEKIERHPIARGAFGDVYQAVYRSEPVALKRMRFFQGIRKRKGKQRVWYVEFSSEHTLADDQQRFFREAVVWKSLNHPSILPFLGLDSDDGGSPSLAMVFLHKKDQTADLDALVLAPIVQGLNYLHFRIIVHGDLRGDNILVDDEGHAQFNSCWTTRWMAPELLLPSCAGLDRFERTFSSDVYSFACVCFELYTGAQPFEEIKIDISRPGRSPEIPARIWQLIRSCWCQELQEVEDAGNHCNFEMMEKEGLTWAGDAAQGEARQSSTPSLSPSVRNPPSLIVNISAPANNETDNWRRRNSFWKPPRFFHEFSPAASWRDRTRAISMLFNKTKSEETPDVRTSSVHAKPQEHQRGRFLSLLPRSKPKISLAPENSEH
ncbi:kinase-like domain-containing protein [Mycena sp. CBHHK59/15]|nr:kinase-like domain-containing protein [Mycena sp. CBHHK59/15]